MRSYTLYHNPRCSKSRQTLQLLKDNNITPEIVLYLEQVPTAETISELLVKLGISARALLRKGELAYKENNLSDSGWSEQAL
ncbi:MAG: arsenate reductase, partial [Paraglaciecola psychrophila]